MMFRGSWWDLPGPRGFILDVLDALEDGSSVILALPPSVPDGLYDSLIAELDDRGTLRWRAIDIAGPKRIAQLMADELVPLVRRSPRSLGDEIVYDPGLGTTVVSVTGLNETGRFREFAAFLAEFLSGVRKVRTTRRFPRLLFSLPHSLLRDPKIEASPNIVRILEWKGRVSPSDMHLYVATRMQGRHGPGPTNLYERIVVELAGWDPKLADELCRWNDDDLLGPQQQLQALAVEWDKATLGWREGTQDSFGARQVNHILYHITNDHDDEVNRRLWRAHVAEIFPWLEEIRMHLIDRFRNEIRLPHMLQTNEIIEDPNLLEIGQLYWNLKYSAGLTEDQLNLVNVCRRARNDLAHRRPVRTLRLRQLETEWKQSLHRKLTN
jgi:hypothetical protein